MVQMVQDRRGYPGSLKRDQERRMNWMNGVEKATGFTGSVVAVPGMVGPDECVLQQSQPTQLDRIEAKLDALLEALADEGEQMEQPELTLDGEAVGGERDDSQPL